MRSPPHSLGQTPASQRGCMRQLRHEELSFVGPYEKFGTFEEHHDLSGIAVEVRAPVFEDLVGNLRGCERAGPKVRRVKAVGCASYLDLSRVRTSDVQVLPRGS